MKDEQDESSTVCAYASDGKAKRVVARTARGRHGGGIGWLRGTNASYYQAGHHLLTSDDPANYFPPEVLMRFMLNQFGYTFSVEKGSPAVKTPLTLVSRSKNGFFFAGYTPDTTASLKLRFPQGAPVLLGYETDSRRSFHKKPSVISPAAL